MMKTTLILGVSSDIAFYLAQRFLKRGEHVHGTFRNESAQVRDLARQGATLSQVDLLSTKSIRAFVDGYSETHRPWETMISAVGQLDPIGPFFSLDFDAWATSVSLNSLAQLHALHALYPLRDVSKPCKVILFAGGGTNNPFDAYSAYSIGKLILIKMCELLHSEYKFLHISIVGTGWVDTKIHLQTIESGINAGANYDKTLAFREHPTNSGTPLADIGDCIDWCLNSPSAAVAGRNFSVVHDPWRQPEFVEILISNPNLCKLRRLSP